MYVREGAKLRPVGVDVLEFLSSRNADVSDGRATLFPISLTKSEGHFRVQGYKQINYLSNRQQAAL